MPSRYPRIVPKSRILTDQVKPASETLVALCVPTFRRNDALRNCLGAVARLRRPPGLRLQVVVADNDAAGAAESVCRESGVQPLHYCVEAKRGLASVRNRLLDEAARMGADWAAFLDDDETPSPDWLLHHWGVLTETGARVSTGPVVQHDAHGEVPSTHKSRRETGSEPRFVACNNVILHRSLFTEQGLRFDERFNLTGGEDFDFFERSRQLHNRHVWAAEAVVFETISEDRDNWRYLFQRHYSGAVNSVMRYRKSHGAWKSWAQHLLKSLGKLLGAIGAALLACVHSRRRNAQNAVKRLASALGYLAGLFNITAERYR